MAIRINGKPGEPVPNGTLCEIISTSRKFLWHNGKQYNNKCHYLVKAFGYPSKHITGLWTVEKYQLKPLSDPDAEIEKELEMVE